MPDSQHCSLSYGDLLSEAVVSTIEITCVHQVVLTSPSTLGSLCRPGLCFQFLKAPLCQKGLWVYVGVLAI